VSQASSDCVISIPGYEVLEELGRGGMGVVYRAQQKGLKRTVALKMMLAGGHASPETRARFRAEAEAVARLQHPNVVQIYEVGEQEGLPYFALEFCPGGSLAGKASGTSLPPRQAAELVQTLARAMHSAHGAKIIHRDLKPANVLFTTDGQPKITDFGLAKMLDESGQTQSGTILGTPSYMAPEQAGGKSKDMSPAADTYSLGAILYELLTGRPPFQASTPLDTMLQVISEDPVPPRHLQPKLPRDLETICLKCLAKNPGARYASAEALADDLHRYLCGAPILARPVSRWKQAAKFVERRPAVAIVVGIVGLGVLGFLVNGLTNYLWFYMAAQVVTCVLTGVMAARKGYSFVLWLLAGGTFILGLLVLSFLGFTNKGDIALEVAQERRKTGNRIGGLLAVFGVLTICTQVAKLIQIMGGR
jgi:serine/threonine protein kinase